MADQHRDQDSQARDKAQQEQQEKQQPEQQPEQGQQPEQQQEQAEPAAEELRDLELEIEQLQARLAHAHEQVLRAQADAQNAMRRAEKDIEKAHKFGQEKLIGEMLVVVDNLERALGAVPEREDEAVKGLAEGVELTLKALLGALKNNNVEQLDPEGEPFNPELHQAMTAVESREVEPNTVLNVYQKGYTLHGRLVRPAMVVVSKAPAQT